jgi:RHS repeat-associated protein
VVLQRIPNIAWTNYQKISAIEKTDRMIRFRYNPMQQRVAKYIKPDASTAEKRTYYVRDAQGNVLAAYSAWVRDSAGITWDSFALAEQHIYGSSRVGYTQPGLMLYPAVPVNPHALDSCHYVIFEGWKRYEISNHLGNVLAVVTDRKRGRASSGTNIQWFVADVLSAQQYYPFGMLMPGNASTTLRRQYSLNSYDYRYGFNGKEGDDEVKGDDNQVDFGARPYDPRSGRWLSVDPMDGSFPDLSPYASANNSPIVVKDVDGKSGEPAIIDGKMVISMDFYFYGTSRSLQDSDNFLAVVPTYLQTELNRYPSTAVGPDGQSYNVEFVVRGYVITETDALEKAKCNVGKNYDPKVNFVRVDNGNQKQNSNGIPSLFYSGSEGTVTGDRGKDKLTAPDNSIWLNTNDMYTTAWLHEVVAHGLGDRSLTSHISDWEKNNPSDNGIASIKTTLATKNVPSHYGQYIQEASRLVLELDRRQILPDDKSSMQIRFWKKDENGINRGIMGGSTNTIFDRNGNQTIFDKDGNQKNFDPYGNPKN